MAGGTNVHRRIHDASLGRAKEKFSGKKTRNRDRDKPGRRSNAQVSLDNADAVIEGAPAPRGFSRGGRVLVFLHLNFLVDRIDANQVVFLH